MRKTILTLLGSALLATATVQIADAAQQGRKVHRAPAATSEQPGTERRLAPATGAVRLLVALFGRILGTCGQCQVEAELKAIIFRGRLFLAGVQPMRNRHERRFSPGAICIKPGLPLNAAEFQRLAKLPGLDADKCGTPSLTKCRVREAHATTSRPMARDPGITTEPLRRSK